MTNVTLVAKGDEDAPTNPVDKENKATIKSEITATQGPVYPVTLPNSATVQAAPPTATLPRTFSPAGTINISVPPGVGRAPT